MFKYLPHLDGLRCIAVVSVILYHVYPTIFSGAYVGVDIFFVLSGYLICSVICNDIANGRFTLLNFWERRSRRIFPALITVLAVSYVFSWKLFDPGDFINYSQSLASISVFLSNILFWRESGYFDDSLVRPLLHTWSLSVEEQFYLLFPFLFIIYPGSSKRVKIMILTAVGVLSFSALLLTTARYPDFSFFMLPTRAWELSLGALVALMQPFLHVRNSVRETLSFCGIILIIFSLIGFGPLTHSPGLSTIIPCIGTALILSVAQGPKFIFGKMFSAPPLVWVGKLSYSLYLWHFPAIVYVEYIQLGYPSAMDKLWAVLLTVPIAYLSWRFVELPIKEGRILKKTRTFYLSILPVFGSFIFLGIYGHINHGVPERFDMGQVGSTGETTPYMKAERNPRTKECHGVSLDEIQKKKSCRFNNELPGQLSVALWGDSHADSIVPGVLVTANKYNVNGIILTEGGCPPLLGIERVDSQLVYEGCHERNFTTRDIIVSEGVKDIILVARWDLYINGATEVETDTVTPQFIYRQGENTFEGTDALRESLIKTVEYFVRQGKRVWLVDQAPVLKFNGPRAAFRLAIRGATQDEMTVELNEHFVRRKEIKKLLDVGIKSGAQYLDLIPFFCDNPPNCRFTLNGKPLYSDTNHLSKIGGEYVSSIFDRIFEKEAIADN